ncbi:MAG: glycosyltransferase family 2 protein [Sulfolobales archaeon]|nr:glycosyltransferase family 2 protein [Sulfolobales archaeon]MDW7969750.1 glycosyltransferase family 2 protein [Sulfolobales archaeon]
MLSIIVPTYNEGENIEELIRRIGKSLNGVEYEVLVVDDNSPDGTADIAEKLSKEFPIKVIRRAGKLGLASAVLEGFNKSVGDYVVVMDADLQHPPEVIPQMYEAVLEGCDVVVASRYVSGGSIVGWGLTRRIVSKTATMLAKLLIPKARNVKDPLSGFFMFKRDSLLGVSLNPKGFKILLELLVKGRYVNVCEVPYCFGLRVRGKSKLGFKEILNYLLHLITLSPYMTLIKFLLVGSLGTLVNLSALYLLRYIIGLEHLISSAVAIEASVINNYLLHELWTFRGRGGGTRLHRLLKFHVTTSLAITTQYVTSQLLHYGLGLESIISQFTGILLGFLINYVLSNSYVWPKMREI